jgi:predicted transcriptional regulator
VRWVVAANNDIVLFALTILELDAGDMESLFDKGETEAGRRRKLYHLDISIDICLDVHLRMRLYRIRMVLLC